MNLQVQQWQEKVESLFQRVKGWLASQTTRLRTAWNNYLRSKAPYLPHSLPQRRHKVVESILSDIHFQENLEVFVSSSGLSIIEVEKKAKIYLTEIASDMSYFSFPLWNKLLGWAFNYFYEDIEINKEALANIRELAGKKPIVFVPNHRSHIDYLLLSYLLYNERLPMPYVCAGINLNFWPLGTIFRKSGAFFIRRRFEGNKLYKTCVEAYLNYLLEKKSFIEFFIEGTRSRTGKLLPAKKGILSLLLQNYWDGGHEDIIFIPTSTVYQSVIEEKSFISEQQGTKKARESFWDLFKLRKLMGRQYGKVYVRFDSPLSLKEWEQANESSPSPLPLSPKGEENVEAIAHHITHGINRSTVVTPISLVAQALLIHPQKNILKSDIEKYVEEALEYLRYKKSPLSSMLPERWKEAIQETITQLVHTKLLSRYQDEEGVFYRLSDKNLSSLDYYKNTSIHFFVSLSVVSTILLKMGARKNQIRYEELEQKYQFVQKIFYGEFIFSHRHQLKDHLTRVLDYLKERNWVTIKDTTITLQKSQPLESSHRILTSYYEAYYAVWKVLNYLQNKTTEKKETERFLLNRTRLQFLRGTIDHPESLNQSLIQNALAAFSRLGIIKIESRGIGKQKKTCYHFSFDQETYDDIGTQLSFLIQ